MVVLIGLTFFLTSSATAIHSKPGQSIPLVLTNYQMETDTPILPDWTPKTIRWKLVNPQGEVVAFKDDSLDSVKKVGSSLFSGSTTYKVSCNSGTMKIPAFAESGTWQLKATFYDKGFLTTSETTETIRPVEISEGTTTENLVSPMYFPFEIPFIGAYCIEIQLIVLIGTIVLMPVLFLIYLETRGGKKIVSRIKKQNNK